MIPEYLIDRYGVVAAAGGYVKVATTFMSDYVGSESAVSAVPGFNVDEIARRTAEHNVSRNVSTFHSVIPREGDLTDADSAQVIAARGNGSSIRRSRSAPAGTRVNSPDVRDTRMVPDRGSFLTAARDVGYASDCGTVAIREMDRIRDTVLLSERKGHGSSYNKIADKSSALVIASRVDRRAIHAHKETSHALAVPWQLAQGVYTETKGFLRAFVEDICVLESKPKTLEEGYNYSAICINCDHHDANGVIICARCGTALSADEFHQVEVQDRHLEEMKERRLHIVETSAKTHSKYFNEQAAIKRKYRNHLGM